MSSKTYFYHGAMRSGKTSDMIIQIYNMKKRKTNIKIIKPSIDTREKGIIKSRALNTFYEAETFTGINELKEILKNSDYDIVFVDEAQFMSREEVLFLIEFTHLNNLKTFFYGLKNSYTGELFIGSKALIENVDSIRELKSTCDKCERKASMHLKKVNGKYVFSGEHIEVGDVQYFSVCPKCFFKEKKNNFVKVKS